MKQTRDCDKTRCVKKCLRCLTCPAFLVTSEGKLFKQICDKEIAQLIKLHNKGELNKYEKLDIKLLTTDESLTQDEMKRLSHWRMLEFYMARQGMTWFREYLKNLKSIGKKST